MFIKTNLKNILFISISTIKSGLLLEFNERAGGDNEESVSVLATEAIDACERFSKDPGAIGTENTFSKEASKELLEKGFGPRRG